MAPAMPPTMEKPSACTPDNSAFDVGKDPPTRIYNGDFFNTTAGSGLLAGYTGSPQITGAPGNPAALLNNSGKSFTHLPALFPLNASSFAFDFNVTGPPSNDALTVTFKRDDDQTFTFTDPNILNSPGSNSRSIDLSDFPSFSQLAGRMASISFTLNTTQTTTSLAVDNLRIDTTGASTGGPYAVGEGQSVVLAGSMPGYGGPLSDLSFAWDFDNDGVYGETGPAAENGNELGATPTFNAALLDGPSTKTVSLHVTGPQGLSAFASSIVTINNVAPTAAFAASSATLQLGGAVTVSFTNQTDFGIADGQTGFRYAYDFNNDGAFELGDGSFNGSITSARMAMRPPFFKMRWAAATAGAYWCQPCGCDAHAV
jgi:hypothetical protein